MTRKLLIVMCMGSLLWSAGLFAESGGAHIEHAGINIRDIAAIQRGARIFVNYCLSCHSANYMRYNRLAEDLHLDPDLVMENLVFADAKIGETMDIAMDSGDAARWFGKAPPDLSPVGRARSADWLYTYMKSFYQDKSGHWNNLVLENASMPHVLWRLQGIQKAVYVEYEGREIVDHLTLAEPGLQSPEAYEDTVRDLVTYLDYMGEPAKLKRKNIGIWVMMFLAAFALLTYALKVEYWRDVH